MAGITNTANNRSTHSLAFPCGYLIYAQHTIIVTTETVSFTERSSWAVSIVAMRPPQTRDNNKIHPPQRVGTLDMPFSFLADSTWNSTTDEKETGIEIGSHFRFYIRLAVVNALL